MIRSMTGYGSAELERDGQRLTAEIRSVNHRYAEVSIRAPRAVSLFEDQVRQLIQEKFSRGKFNLTIGWSGAGEQGEELKLNELVADRYVALLRQIQQRYDLEGGVDARTLAQLPDVFSWEHSALSDEETWALVKAVVEKACDSMTAMKSREGAALTADLEGRLAIVRRHLDQISERAPFRPIEAKERLMARLKPLLADVEIDPARLAQEVALMADRLDCTEECVRLSAHLDQFRSLIEGPELAGRKLNFLLQEMNREVNTIGSKADGLQVSGHIIDLKAELERMREQVQNVE